MSPAIRLRKMPDATRNAWRFDAPWLLGSFAAGVTSRMNERVHWLEQINYKRYLRRCQLRFWLLLLCKCYRGGQSLAARVIFFVLVSPSLAGGIKMILVTGDGDRW